MPNGHSVTLGTPYSRAKAQQLIWSAPDGYVASIAAPRRSGDQNDKMWAMLTDVSVSMPDGKRMTPDQWKCVFMQACGWEVQFLEGLDGQPFPAGFRSSRMTKKQMSDLIEFIQAWGDERGIRWTDPEARAA